MLLEPQRTNLITNSEYYDSSAGWEPVGSFTPNVATSPEGLTNASSLDTDYLEVRPSVVSGTDYTYSIFVKANTDTTPEIRFAGTSFPARQANYDLTTGEVTSYTTKSAGIEDYGNGWYRVYATETATATDSTSRLRFYCETSYIYGAQFEAGSYATSYIPTYGSAVTRNMEPLNLFDLQDNGLVTSTTGTLFLHPNDYSQNAIQFGFEDDSNTSGFRIRFRDASILIYERVGGSNVEVADINESNAEKKLAISWNNTNLLVSVNGTTTTHTITSAASGGVQNLKRLNSSSVLIPMNQILVFPTQLTEAELNDLTTI